MTHMSKKKVTRFALLLLIATFMMTFGLKMITFANSSESESINNYETFQSVRVIAGDTLWGLASEFKPEHQSIQDYIREMKKINKLKNSKLQIGQKLLLPN